MPPENGRKTRDVLRIDFDAPFVQSCECFLHVDDIPVRDCIESQAERAQLLLLSLLQGVADITPNAVVDLSGAL